MKIIIAVVTVIFSLTTYAQSKDYIVKYNGDTIVGEVNILQKQIKITRPGADIITLDSKDVRLFVHNNTAKTVLRTILYGYTDNIETVQDPGYSDPVYDTTILLTPIISGQKLNLFHAKDKRKVDYFFVQRREDSIPTQLLYAVGGHMPNKASWGIVYTYVSYITRYKIFENQLREMTGDCDAITQADLEMLTYLESSLKSFIKRYNKKCN